MAQGDAEGRTAGGGPGGAVLTLELANLALAAYMTGVIWLVQRVHYPLLAFNEAPEFGGHAQRITPVVGPPMLAQVVVAVLLAGEGALGVANLALVGLVFASTALYFGPMHDGLRPDGVGRLVRDNWARTVLWTAQLGVALALAAQA